MEIRRIIYIPLSHILVGTIAGFPEGTRYTQSGSTAYHPFKYAI
jgi:hypothetical protein